MELDFFNDDDNEIPDYEDIENQIEKTKDLEMTEQSKENLANLIDFGIHQAMNTGRMEADVRSLGGRDPMLMAVGVSAASSVITAILFAYQFYL